MKTQTPSFCVGEPVPDWHGCPAPVGVVLTGNECRLWPIDPARHAGALFQAYSQMADTRDWLYLSVGPFPDAQAYLAYAEKIARETDPLHFAVVDLRHELPGGTLALMRRQPQHGVLEVGFMAFSPTLQRSRISTEAQFLLMSHLFDELGYRRYEWKCDSLNERSRNAAERLGFQYEGTFRQALVYKGRNRDTAAAGNLTRKLSIMNKIATAIRSAHLDQSGIPRPLPSTRWREAIDANVRRDRP